MLYMAKSPWLLKKIYGNCTWSIPTREKVLYLTFDDGPHPSVTNLVLDELKHYGAKATFFCIGKNVVEYPAVFRRIVEESHGIGNHSFNHLNGWKTEDRVYLDDIAHAKKYIDSRLYRPPYGRISLFQLKQLSLPRFNLKTIMWSVLSGDFDTAITGEECSINVIKNAGPGSIVVFHDSEKAAKRMQFALSATLAHFSNLGYRFEKITPELL